VSDTGRTAALRSSPLNVSGRREITNPRKRETCLSCAANLLIEDVVDGQLPMQSIVNVVSVHADHLLAASESVKAIL
jgi:hypothetical protein